MINGIYYCPHHPDEECDCRKPSIGMVESARRDLGLQAGSYMIGDAASDIELGHRAGLRTILVLTGRGRDQLRKMKSAGDGMPWMVVRDLTEAVEAILSDHSVE